jgi:beta-glucanase (GH16 family)
LRRPVNAADRARIAAYRSGGKRPVIATRFTDPSQLQAKWSLQSDDNPGLRSCRRPASVAATTGGLILRTLAAADCRVRWSTGFMISRTKQRFGFFEAAMKIADISGMNNAFWLVTDDGFEIDIAEVHYPNDIRLTLHNNNNWDTEKNDRNHAVGFDSRFRDDFSSAFHDYGVLWTATEIIFEIDGEPTAAITTNGAITGAADIRFSTALADWAGKVPDHPEGHGMTIKSLRVFDP